MFRAIADQLLFHPTQPIQCNYQDIRNAAVAYLRRNKSWLEVNYNNLSNRSQKKKHQLNCRIHLHLSFCRIPNSRYITKYQTAELMFLGSFQLQISGYTADYRLSYDDYCTFMSMDKKWGDHVILYVLSLILPIPIKVVSCGVTWTANEHLDESEVFPMQYDIVLVYKNKNHYMSSSKCFKSKIHDKCFVNE